jgi:signal transduction histidine kinase
VPVAFEEDVGPRLASAVETALYYVIAEALTNVERYAEASCATVSVHRDADAVEVAIVDDGRGGADRARASGLRRLEDRLSAVDGVLELDSPPGGGTTVRVRVPLGAPEPA